MKIKPNYRYFKSVVLILAIIGMFSGTLISALVIKSDSEATDFMIDEDTVRKYGFFDEIGETTITGTILKPSGVDIDKSKERPCVFVFHGMFMNRFLQMQTAMYFVKAGMYVVILDHAGQGESMGKYRLGPELEALGKTVIDYFIAEGFEKFNMNVDLDALGCNGHSYGGVTSAFAGVNRDNRLKAIASIWSWSELPQTVADIMTGVGTKPEDLFDNPIYKFLTTLTGFGDAIFYDREGGYSQKPEDVLKVLEDRNMKTRVNYTKKLPPNWLLITAENDELTSPDQQIELMAKASWNSTAGGSYSAWENELSDSIKDNKQWTNLGYSNNSIRGSFGSRTARSLFLPEGDPFGHLMEGFLVSAYVKVMEWFGDAFNWDVKEVVDSLKENGLETDGLGMDGPVPALATLKYGGWIIALLSLIISLPALISIIVKRFKFDGNEDKYQEFINSYDEFSEYRYGGFEMKLIGIAVLIYLGAEFLSILLPMELGLNPKILGIPFIITDALTVIMAMRYFIVLPAILLLFYYLVKKIKRPLNLKKIGISTNKKAILNDLVLGGVIGGFFILFFNVISFISLSPRLIPRRSPTLGYFGFLLLVAYFFIFFLIDEISFRGIIQTKIHDFIYTKLQDKPAWLKKWLEYIIATGFQMIVLLGGTFLGLVLLLGGLPPVLVTIFLIGGFSSTFIPAFLSTYIYQRTRRIIPCVLSSTLILSFLLGSSLFGATIF
ncbi:MAG: alpha/beta hydrolase family protein [Promethearchaeia archaeon]